MQNEPMTPGWGRATGVLSPRGRAGVGPRPLRAAAFVLVASGLAVVGSVAGPLVVSAATPTSGAGMAGRIRLPGPAPALPAGAAVIGPAAGATRITADVSVAPRDPDALAGFAEAVSTPGSPQFHHYLSRGQFATVFGPTASTLAAVRSWLASSGGLRVGTTSQDGLLIPVTGTVDQMEQAFAVPLVEARLSTGRVAREGTANPEVPATLAGAIGGVIGLSTVAEAHPQIRPGPSVGAVGTPGPNPGESRPAAVPHAGPAACPAASSVAADHGAWTADQLASTYGLSTLYGQGRVAAGQQVGIFELEPFSPGDIATYEACFGVDASVSTVDVDGGATGGQIGEAALDIEVVAGLAPSAAITVFSGPNTGAGPINTYEAMVGDPSIKVLTTSWGECEGPGGIDHGQQQVESALFEEAAADGQTLMAASGDSGSSDCYDPIGNPPDLDKGLFVDDPADQPFVTGAGGTSLTSPVSTPASETVWNDGPAVGAGGGGDSIDFPANAAQFAALSYQHIPAVESVASDTCGPSSNEQCRTVPDVAASSDPEHGDVIFFGGTWTIFGGTSAAAPLWAALTADTNQGCTNSAGFLNPALYNAGADGSPAFNDITVGDNNLFGNPEYAAGTGYDLASGWGSPQAVGLMGSLSGSSAGCPAITGLSPNSGPARGGRSVVISGSGFGTGSPTVHFGGLPVPVNAYTPDSITVTTPDVGSATQLPVTVTTTGPASGTSAVVPASEYTFVSPQVSRVVPGKGPTSGGGRVTITGSDFAAATSVFFGSSPSPSFTVLSPDSLVAQVPAGPAGGGVVDVVVASPDGTSPRVAGDHYTYALPGYWLVAADGGIFAFGHAGFHGSTGGLALNKPMVGMAATPDDGGYWLVASDGGIFTYGDAGFYGSTGNLVLNKPVVGMAAAPDGNGYWLVASDGGVFAYGDAGFYGSSGNLVLNKPIVGMAATPDGNGYWLVASDGGVFAYGDAGFYGSTGNLVLNKPIVGMAATPDGNGYWLVASDGGVFAYGDAGFYGSSGNLVLNKPIVGMAASLAGNGYWLVASDGGVFAYGDAGFYGSTGSLALVQPMVGMAAT